MKIAMLHTTIRGDEKLLLDAARRKNIELVPVDVRKQIFNPQTWNETFDVVLERCISTTSGMHAISFFEAIGVQVVNSSRVANICVDKFTTSLKLHAAGVPTVLFAMAFTEQEAITAIEQLGGYPVVIKPATGSWGRLLAKINDQDALEAVLEQKSVLGSPQHKAFYIQQFIEKPDRDIRVTMAGEDIICAIYRETKHWISNTARGAQARECEITPELETICKAASNAVGGGILGVDVFETANGFIINEVNHTTEFKNVQNVTGVDVAGAILDYCVLVAQNSRGINQE
jgi:[lysine-biosynthesis-protein LysW]---L-2-aminoadipate ligase